MKMYGEAAAVVFLYGVVNNVVFGRSLESVSREAAILMVLFIGVWSIIYSRRSTRAARPEDRKSRSRGMHSEPLPNAGPNQLSAPESTERRVSQGWIRGIGHPVVYDPKSKKALITGITGQDGSFLAELLLAKGYEVHGIVRQSSTHNTSRLAGLYSNPDERGTRLFLYEEDLGDGSSLGEIIRTIRPAEVYNLAAQTDVQSSFARPEYTFDIVANGTLRILEALYHNDLPVRIYQAGCSQMFGSSVTPLKESTAFYPRSPFAVAKVAAHWLSVHYREARGFHISNGLLFSHTSPRQASTFVFRKITRALARIKLGLQDKLRLGNLEAKRDWGYAGDYVEAMWLMLQQDVPDDYVIATGEAHSVRELLELAAERCGIDWRAYVVVDLDLFRPTEVACLLGDSSKARSRLGWAPRVTFGELVAMMIDYEIEVAMQGFVTAGHRGTLHRTS
jgi:GDPmannose 4,6-dehydratase